MAYIDVTFVGRLKKREGYMWIFFVALSERLLKE
jgi:hypothetical protein